MFVPAPLERVLRDLADLGADDPTTWSRSQLATATAAWCQARSRLDAVGASLLAAWDGQAAWGLDGAASGAQWLRTRGDLDHPGRHLAVARTLRDHAPRTAAALAAGQLSYAKAAALATAVTPELAADFAECEATLVDAARTLTLGQTRRLAAHWKAVAADTFDPVARHETRRQQRSLRIWETFDGMIAIEGLLDPELGTAVWAALRAREEQLLHDDVREAKALAHTSTDTTTDTVPAAEPSRSDPTDGATPDPATPSHRGDDPAVDAGTDATPSHDTPGLARTAAQRRADALGELCRLGADAASSGHADDRLGGPDTQLVLTVTLAELAHATRAGASGRTAPTVERLLTAAHLDGHDAPLDADLVELLACDCTVTRLVVDGDGVPLHLGRTQRLASRSQRLALRQRDGGCAFPGCDRPASWCDAHHVVPWEADGPTDLDNLVLLCRHHHRRVHGAERWGCRIDPATGRPAFTRPDGTTVPPPGLPTAPLPPSRPPDRQPPDREHDTHRWGCAA